jgi:hypothetical protein
VSFSDTDEITSQEVLRVYSAGPIKERMAVRDVVIPLKERIITALGEQITAIPVSKGGGCNCCASVLPSVGVPANHSNCVILTPVDSFHGGEATPTNLNPPDGLTVQLAKQMLLVRTRICVSISHFSVILLSYHWQLDFPRRRPHLCRVSHTPLGLNRYSSQHPI